MKSKLRGIENVVNRRGKKITINSKVVTKELDLSTVSDVGERRAIHQIFLREVDFYIKNKDLFPDILNSYSNSSSNPFLILNKKGTPVLDLLKTNKSVTFKMKLVKEVLRFYKNLHLRGILHRDIQPSHLFWFKSKIYAIDFELYQDTRSRKKDINYKGGLVHFVSSNIARLMLGENSNYKYNIGDEYFSLGLTIYYLIYKKSYIETVSQENKELSFEQKKIIMRNFDVGKLRFEEKYKKINKIILGLLAQRQKTKEEIDHIIWHTKPPGMFAVPVDRDLTEAEEIALEAELKKGRMSGYVRVDRNFWRSMKDRLDRIKRSYMPPDFGCKL